MAILLITLVVVLVIVGKGLAIRRQERSLGARLIPVEAKVRRRGDNPEIQYLPTSDSDDTDRQREVLVYTGTWEYVVAGKAYEGEVEQSSPVFRADQMPPAKIQVFYDPAHPAVSRLHPGADASNARAWFIFAGVAGAVGLVIALVAEGGKRPPR